ncbi:MAG: S41 family peptidase [Bacteroidota bacterium]
MKSLILCLIVVTTCVSCERQLLGEAEPNSPENNLELFWDDFDQHYGLFQARGWNWDSIYQVYQPQVNAQTTDAELWRICREMIAYLDDSHTFLYDPSAGDFFASGSEEDSAVATEFSLELLRNTYLDQVIEYDLSGEPDESYLFGTIRDKKIAYLYLSDIEAEDEDFMDEVIPLVRANQALILDLRNNTGGSDEIAAAIAGRFIAERELAFTVQTRNGPNHDDFTEKRKYYAEPLGEETFPPLGASAPNPLILLTDNITVSAAEVLCSYLKTRPHTTQIGDTTAGDFSDVGMRRFLPNGWQYQYSIMMYLQADGSSLDGIGHVPDLQVRNSLADLQASKDQVLERAMEFLSAEYGIE